jgi:hypothetical protein
MRIYIAGTSWKCPILSKDVTARATANGAIKLDPRRQVGITSSSRTRLLRIYTWASTRAIRKFPLELFSSLLLTIEKRAWKQGANMYRSNTIFYEYALPALRDVHVTDQPRTTWRFTSVYIYIYIYMLYSLSTRCCWSHSVRSLRYRHRRWNKAGFRRRSASSTTWTIAHFLRTMWSYEQLYIRNSVIPCFF